MIGRRLDPSWRTVALIKMGACPGFLGAPEEGSSVSDRLHAGSRRWGSSVSTRGD